MTEVKIRADSWLKQTQSSSGGEFGAGAASVRTSTRFTTQVFVKSLGINVNSGLFDASTKKVLKIACWRIKR